MFFFKSWIYGSKIDNYYLSEENWIFISVLKLILTRIKIWIKFVFCIYKKIKILNFIIKFAYHGVIAAWIVEGLD